MTRNQLAEEQSRLFLRYRNFEEAQFFKRGPAWDNRTANEQAHGWDYVAAWWAWTNHWREHGLLIHLDDGRPEYDARVDLRVQKLTALQAFRT